jgi:hypothetical protein
MRKYGWYLIVGVLILLNGVLLWRMQTVSRALRAVTGDEAYLTIMDSSLTDMRGVYTYPTLGKYFFRPEDTTVYRSLSMLIFLSAKTDCPMNMMELDVFKRLVPLFKERGQLLSVACSNDDSAAVAQILDSAGLNVPLCPGESKQFSFSQMGISPKFMPFKVLFDSSYTAIYMRGADTTPQSKEGFEAAARRLSDLAWKGQL